MISNTFCNSLIFPILFISASPQVDGATIAFALAHNTVIHWDWSRGEVLDRRECVEKCILYPFTLPLLNNI